MTMTDTDEPKTAPLSDCGACPIEDTIVARLQQILDGQLRIEANVNLVSSDLGVVKDRMRVVESRLSVVEESRKSTSDRVRAAEAVDSEHDLKIAEANDRMDKLADAVEKVTGQNAAILRIAERAEAGWEKLSANPRTKLIIAAVVYAAYRYLEAHFPSLSGIVPSGVLP
jgi:septal ring factor EnvC (AmiA/AmiB activator)